MPNRNIAVITFDIHGVPELIADLRHEMGEMLRDAADEEVSTYVKDRLREVAAEFECGNKEGV